MPHLSTFDWNLKMILSYLKSAPSNLSNCKISRKNKKKLKFGIKNTLFGYFWARISKNYCHIWNQLPQICLIVKFFRKTKMPKCGIKNALHRHFWTPILNSYCHIWNRHLRFCLITKFCAEMKMSKFGTRNALFKYFWLKMPYLGIFVEEF